MGRTQHPHEALLGQSTIKSFISSSWDAYGLALIWDSSQFSQIRSDITVSHKQLIISMSVKVELQEEETPTPLTPYVAVSSVSLRCYWVYFPCVTPVFADWSRQMTHQTVHNYQSLCSTSVDFPYVCHSCHVNPRAPPLESASSVLGHCIPLIPLWPRPSFSEPKSHQITQLKSYATTVQRGMSQIPSFLQK